MHHDGMRFFPLPAGQTGSTHGLLAINHEYTDDGLLHPDGMLTWTAEKVRKSQAAHGISVIEVRLDGNRWRVVRPSRYARRVTAATPMGITGPAAGHAWMRTAADPAGRTALGTMSNCAMGYTPWGTYLTCEENFQFYFVNRSGQRARAPAALRHHRAGRRVPLARVRRALRCRAPSERAESLRLGRRDRSVRPVAAAREAHRDGPLQARGRRPVDGAGPPRGLLHGRRRALRVRLQVREPRSRPHRHALEHGTLYAARFDADGTGVWLELAPGQNGLDAGAGFPSQAEICIAPRLAGDVAGATKMDRPEWIAVHPKTGEVYCALSYNETRGQSGRPGPDPANPRAENVYGHIIRWRERGGDPTATRFEWDVFILCGDPASADAAARRYQGRRLRLAGRAVGGRARRAVDPDRRVHPAPPQGRLRGHGQQPDAGRRSGHAGGAALPHRPQRLRGHRARPARRTGGRCS